MGRDMFLAFFLAAALTAAGCWLCGRLLCPGRRTDLVGLIPGRGDGGALEQSVRALVWLRKLGLMNCTLVIVDLGLTPAGRRLADQLSLRWRDVLLLRPGQLPRCVEELDRS